MKKVSLLLLTVLLSLPIFAQPKFGIKGGLNMANIEASSSGITLKPDSRTAFFAGINIDIQLNEKFSFSPGIQYTGRGYKLSASGATAELKLDYIDIPLLLNFKVPISETANIFLFGGGIPGILLSANGESSYKGQSTSVDIKDQLESFHFGLTFGGGIEIISSTLIIIPQIYYTIGLTNLDKSTSGSSSGSNSSTSSVRDLSFGLGIRF